MQEENENIPTGYRSSASVGKSDRWENGSDLGQSPIYLGQQIGEHQERHEKAWCDRAVKCNNGAV